MSPLPISGVADCRTCSRRPLLVCVSLSLGRVGRRFDQGFERLPVCESSQERRSAVGDPLPVCESCYDALLCWRSSPGWFGPQTQWLRASLLAPLRRLSHHPPPACSSFSRPHLALTTGLGVHLPSRGRVGMPWQRMLLTLPYGALWMRSSLQDSKQRATTRSTLTAGGLYRIAHRTARCRRTPRSSRSVYLR